MYLYRSRLSYLALATLSCLLLLLAACGSTNSGNTNTSPIEIGWDGALTGTNADLGEWDTQGIDLAFDQVNAKGGIHGRQIHLTKFDDAADNTKGVTNVQRLITQDHIVACFCTTNSGVALAVEPYLTRAKIAQITPGLSTALTAQNSAYIFRDTPAGPSFENTLITYLVQQKHFTKFAQITDNDAYGQGEAQYQQAKLKSFGLTPVAPLQMYNPNDTSFTGQLDTILAANPEVILFGGEEVTSGLIAKQARQLGFTGQLAGGASIGTPTFIQTAGSVAEGVIFTSAYIDNNANAQTKAFAAAFQDKWGYAPEGHGAKAYDGAELVIQALNAAYPNITGDSVAKALHNIHNYQGLQGTANFDATGEGFHDTLLGVIKNGQLTQLS
ncbi:MAG TPA: ABC transporter substrate-binding protein [Ktedonobacteraceae bacterium]|nr:ABC transporter substrate-binding protein [Ktedonobacteraceae bacterium]